MIRNILFVFCCFSSLSLSATQQSPWFGRDFEFELRQRLSYQTYKEVDVGEGCVDHYGRNFFLNSSLAIAILDEYSLEVEIDFADTRERSFYFGGGKITGRYLLWNDCIGDPISLVIGTTLAFPTSASLHDFNTLVRGKAECELHLSFGKELACKSDWWLRGWALTAIGIGDYGSPWLRGYGAIEYNRWSQQSASLYVEGIYGLGHSPLNIDHFRGYGPIQYQSIAVGAAYRHLYCDWLILSLDYSYRIHTKNLPKNLHEIGVMLTFPFGI